MSFRSRGSFERRPFRGESRGRFHSGGGRMRRPFNSAGSYSDRGGRYNSFRGSRGGWFNKERDDRSSRHSPESTRSHDRYSDSHHYSSNRGRDDSFHRKYKEDSSSYKRSYGDNSDEHGGGHNFKSESGFKRPSHNTSVFHNSQYEEFRPSYSYAHRISRSGSRGGSRGSAFIRRGVPFRRPYNKGAFFRGRGFRSSRYIGARFSAVSSHKLKMIRMLRMKNAARGLYDRDQLSSDDGDKFDKMSDFGDKGYSEEGEEGEQLFEENKNEEPVTDENGEGTTKKRPATDSPKKSTKKRVSMEESKDDSANEEEAAKRESGTGDVVDKAITGSNKFIHLECPHCKQSYKTFAYYNYHLHGPEHQTAMMNLLEKSRRKLMKLRWEQRKKQEELDQQDDSTRPFYCEVCKLNYKQPKTAHHSSDYHQQIIQFLHPRCKVCRLKFLKPIVYEHHRASLTHIKRKAYLKRQADALKENVEESGEQFITLDSVGSGDDEAEGDPRNDDENVTENNERKEEANVDESKEEKKSVEGKTTIDEISKKYVKPVKVYYCKLCSVCLPYTPTCTASYVLKVHCKERSHIRRIMRIKSEQSAKKKLMEKPEQAGTSGKGDVKKQNDVKEQSETMLQADDKDSAGTSADEEEEEENVNNNNNNDNNKTSEDDCYENTEDRFDKFG